MLRPRTPGNERLFDNHTYKFRNGAILRHAWRIRREAAAKWNCPVSEILFGECMKEAWQIARESREAYWKEYGRDWEAESVARSYTVNRCTREDKKTVQIPFNSYNSKKFSKPWGGIATNYCGIEIQFTGDFHGTASKGGYIEIYAQPGDVVAAGQKGHIETAYYVVNADLSLTEISREVARDTAYNIDPQRPF